MRPRPCLYQPPSWRDRILGSRSDTDFIELSTQGPSESKRPSEILQPPPNEQRSEPTSGSTRDLKSGPAFLGWQRGFHTRSPIPAPRRQTLTLPRSSRRPVSTQNCWSEACSVHWRVSLWSLCTATCGNYGFQARRVECVHARTNKAVPEHLCSWGPRPANWQRCNITPCENSTFQPQRAFCQVPIGQRGRRAGPGPEPEPRPLDQVSQGH